MPRTMCRVLLYASTGLFRVRWWRRFGLARRRAALSERVASARVMMQTAVQFCLPSVTRATPSVAVSELAS